MFPAHVNSHSVNLNSSVSSVGTLNTANEIINYPITCERPTDLTSLLAAEMIQYTVGYEEFANMLPFDRARLLRLYKTQIRLMYQEYGDCKQCLRKAVCSLIGKMKYVEALREIKMYHPDEWNRRLYESLKPWHVIVREKLSDTDTLFPIFRKILREIEKLPCSLLFRVPVDKNIAPAYYDIVKDPIDLTFILTKLYSRRYTVETFLSDFWKLFTNVCIYNGMDAVIYKDAMLLEKEFSKRMAPVAAEYGYCCSNFYLYTPIKVFCFNGNGKSLCKILPGATYYSFAEKGEELDNCYDLCQDCYQKLPPEGLNINVFTNLDPEYVLISQFKEQSNFCYVPESMEKCLYCGRSQHTVCSLYYDKLWNDAFVCKECSVFHPLPELKYTATRLPVHDIAVFIQDRINEKLEASLPLSWEEHKVSVRLASNVPKNFNLTGRLKDLHLKEDQPISHDYLSKVLLAFQGTEGKEIFFFAMYIQEYPSAEGCNRRKVYIAYIDSVFHFSPKDLRTTVYHEIILSYLQYAKRNNYITAHIWACPPMENDDYIFNCHPAGQKIPKAKRLENWYKELFQVGMQRKIIQSYRNMYEQLLYDSGKLSQIPVFDGDHWPTVIEECLDEAEKELTVAAGKLKRKSKSPLLDTHGNASAKVSVRIEQNKTAFFVVQLNDPLEFLGYDVKDQNPQFSCHLADSRDEFVSQCRNRRWEFSSVRHSLYSTKCVSYHLHNQVFINKT